MLPRRAQPRSWGVSGGAENGCTDASCVARLRRQERQAIAWQLRRERSIIPAAPSSTRHGTPQNGKTPTNGETIPAAPAAKSSAKRSLAQVALQGTANGRGDLSEHPFRQGFAVAEPGVGDAVGGGEGDDAAGDGAGGVAVAETADGQPERLFVVVEVRAGAP